MSLTIPQSSALAAPASRLRWEQSRNRRATMIALAFFLALFATELAVVVALAPSIDPLSALAPLD